MLRMADGHKDWPLLLSSAPASPGHRRTAVVVGLLILVAFIATVPIAQRELVRFPGIILIQNTIAFLSDAITASLLFGQYAVSRSRALCILAFGYLFTALMAVSHALSFPEVFSATGLINGTSWLYPVWHAVLPSSIVVFALRRPDEYPRAAVRSATGAIVFTTLSAGALALACTWLVSAADPWLPVLVQDGRLLPASRAVVVVLLLLPMAALLMLAIRKGPSTLDVWLMVMMFSWLCTISLVTLVSARRYDAGWYAGRIFEVLTSLFVLVLLLSETIGLYAHNIRAATVERRERERRLNEMEAVLVHLSRVQELGQNVSTLVRRRETPRSSASLRSCIPRWRRR